MFKFLGIDPPLKKQKVTTKEANKIYDSNKRKRKIVPSWKEEFSWLLTNEGAAGEDEKVYCKICREVYGPLASRKTADKFKKYANGPFVMGCSSLRHDGLTGHEQSTAHKEAVTIHRAKFASAAEKTNLPASKMIQSMNSKNMSRLRCLFHNAHAIAINSRPVTDFKWMCQVDDKKQVDLGPTYRNDKSCKQFLVAISEVVRSEIEADLAKAHYISVMSDGSTDVSVIENEMVYVHFVTHGETHCYFLGCIACETGDATGIYNAILKSFGFENLARDDILKKIIAFVGDGASVNTGHINGVISMFRNHVNPSIIMVKCMSHRIELAFKDSMNKSKSFKQVHELLDLLFKFYHKSPKQTSGLKRAFEALDKPNVSLTRVGGTRWVGHTQTALKNMVKAYPALVMHLGQVAISPSQSASQSKAKHMLSKLKSKDVLKFAHFLLDLLVPMVKLSMHLQQRATCVYEVHQFMQASTVQLKKLETRPGAEERKMENCGDTFEGQSLTASSSSSRSKDIPVIVSALLSSLETRFSDVSGGLMEGTKLADLTTWPVSYDDAIDFGDDLLERVLDHFRSNLESNGVDAAAAEGEWTELKQALYNNGHKVHTMTWGDINSLFRSKCPNILEVVDLLLSLPAGSAECERGFSKMKAIKTQYRNKMSANTLTLLMTIQLHSPTISEFKPDTSIMHWNQHGHRRPTFMERKKRTPLQAIEAVTEEAANDSGAEEATNGAEGEGGKDSDYDSDFSDLGIHSGESDTDGEFEDEQDLDNF